MCLNLFIIDILLIIKLNDAKISLKILIKKRKKFLIYKQHCTKTKIPVLPFALLETK